MHIVVLMENTPGMPGCAYEHGLSFYAETAHHKILLDTGASDGFIRNAELLGIDLAHVDTVILSHGHYDHCGGVMAFAKIDPEARIYIRDCAGGEFFHVGEDGIRYIGIDKEILSLPQVIAVERRMQLDDEIGIFTNITGRRCYSTSNDALKIRLGDRYKPDPFRHEMCTVLHDGGKNYLFSGCAHSGILNILDSYRDLYGGFPDVVLTGFHFMKKSEYTDAEKRNILTVAKELSGMPTVFYSGHCTGETAFAMMKEIMGEQLHELHSGMTVL